MIVSHRTVCYHIFVGGQAIMLWLQSWVVSFDFLQPQCKNYVSCNCVMYHRKYKMYWCVIDDLEHCVLLFTSVISQARHSKPVKSLVLLTRILPYQ